MSFSWLPWTKKRRAIQDGAVEQVALGMKRSLITVSFDKPKHGSNSGAIPGTVHFWTEGFITDIGNVTVALTGGYMFLTAHDGFIPRDSLPQNYCGTVRQYDVTVVQGENIETASKAAREASGAAKQAPEASLKSAVENSRRVSDSANRTVAFKDIHLIVTGAPDGQGGAKLEFLAAKGSDALPQPLRGMIADSLFCFQPNEGAERPSVEVRFRPGPAHVKVLSGDGRWAEDLGAKKRKLMNILLHKLLADGDWDLGTFPFPPEDRAARIE